MPDPLEPLLALADVPESVDAARAAADAAFAHPGLRRGAGRVAVEVNLRTAVASAAMEGAGYEVDDVRLGSVTDPLVHAALRINGELDRLAPRWLGSPPQVLARLHVLVARDGVVEPGRPSGADTRLVALLDVLRTSRAPALVRAAVVHGELLALRAFEGPNGILARAAGRLTLIAAGLDPSGLLPVDAGHLARQPEYVGAAGAFATGTPDGLRSWIKHCAAAVEMAAAQLREICDELG